MNEADGQKIATWYDNRGWQVAEKIEEAEEVVIVSCSVRQSAENRAYGLINNLANTHSRIILTGCILRYPLEKLRKKLPGVAEFKKINDYTLNEQRAGSTPDVCETLIGSVAGETKVDSNERERTALVPITEGCSHFCTYCVVPSARGPEKSRPFEEIICEAENLAERGVKEILLLGQNVNSYGHDFSLLLKRLHEIAGLEKISFLTSNPLDLTDDIIETMKLPKIDRYLHLPVQAGDDEILRRMNRPYTAKEYLNLVNKIRKAIPDITIGTDIIVGFPGETKEQFQKTVDLCQKVKFIKAYVAEYSPRPNTAAYALKDDVPPKEKKRRWRILEELINKKSRI